MKRFIFNTVNFAAALITLQVGAQDLHFSQYYNAPMLVNPANTGLMPANDFRLGANYRNQWASIPVPYRTLSFYGDFQALRSSEMREASNWLGTGFAFFSDKAGDGELSLNRYEAFLAYHLSVGDNSMLSAGLSGAYVQRSVDFSKLTFDAQWDGFSFNGNLPNNEKPGVIKTSFFDVGAGLNYALFPNEHFYLKIGVGVAHINQPTETFYGLPNRLGFRPSGNIDAFIRVSDNFIVNPSFYYSTQKAASEMVYGSLFQVWLGGQEEKSNQLLLGIYHRWNEAIVPAVGFELGSLRLMATYDYTVSGLSVANKGHGAMEFAVRYMGNYGKGGGPRSLYNCPRF